MCLFTRSWLYVLCLVLILIIGAIVIPLTVSSLVEVEAIRERPFTDEHDLGTLRMERTGGESQKWMNERNDYRWNGGPAISSEQAVKEELKQEKQEQEQELEQLARQGNYQDLRATILSLSLQLQNEKLYRQQKELEEYMKLHNPGLINGKLGPIGPVGLTMNGGPVVHPGAPPIPHDIKWHQGSPEKQWLDGQSASNPAMPPIGWSARQSAANGNGYGNGNAQNNIGHWVGNPVPVGAGGTLNYPQYRVSDP